MIGLMVVDDEEGVRRSLRKVLEKDGYDILLAENGEQAVHMARENHSRLETVISDFKMPGMDGLETLIEIGKINPEITRIMLTGYATMESAIESVNAGIDGFLTKPFDNLELRAKVREYNVKKRLKQFVSEQIITELQRDGRTMAPRNLTASVLFIDIRGFSGLSEAMTPDELSEMLNVHFFSPMDNIIYEFNGTLDKHIGDSIMGIFGAPVTYGDDALRAVSSALSMMDEMETINEKLEQKGRKISVGIGIGTGEVMAGIFGSSRKKEYTIFGLPVVVAARLEQIARPGQILICDETYQRVQDFMHAEKVEFKSIKGIEKKFDFYSVLGKK
ncbi:MAG: adenylate/guanylate cyclase domain-containing protein [Syntrophales bacterium]|nr:adenylate/guanylate cyclase domain-containing protein [Syntrophales bacterium]